MCRVNDLVLFRIRLFVSEYFMYVCMNMCACAHVPRCRRGGQKWVLGGFLSPSPLSFLFYCFSILLGGLSLNLEVTFSSARLDLGSSSSPVFSSLPPPSQSCSYRASRDHLACCRGAKFQALLLMIVQQALSNTGPSF